MQTFMVCFFHVWITQLPSKPKSRSKSSTQRWKIYESVFPFTNRDSLGGFVTFGVDFLHHWDIKVEYKLGTEESRRRQTITKHWTLQWNETLSRSTVELFRISGKEKVKSNEAAKQVQWNTLFTYYLFRCHLSSLTSNEKKLSSF